jgi:simple sugar transport system permease protein
MEDVMKRLRAFVGVMGKVEGLPIALVLVAVFAVFIISAPTVFLKPGIYMSFFETVPPMLICGLGLTLVITAGEIDLSFPAVVALSGFVLSWTYKNLDPSWGLWVGVILALAAGAFVGYTNGLLVAKLGVPSIMATLAAQFFWYGVTILIAGGLQVALIGIKDHLLHKILVGQFLKGETIGGQYFSGLPVQALWALLLTVVMWFILNRHPFGEAVSFIGDNANVARVMGINVERTRILLFTLHGIISAFAGIILTFDIGVFYPTQGDYLLPVMAGVFVGGTSIAGGAGSMVGTFFGMYIIGSLEAGVVATTISGYWVRVVEGTVMGGVVVLNAIMGEGRLAALNSRLRHWSTPAHSIATKEHLEGPGGEVE